jgi:hypothetical protein
MSFSSLGGVTAAYVDGSLAPARSPAQNRVLVIGAAPSGPSDEIYGVGSINQAEQVFGVESEVMKRVWELFTEGADNIGILRCGGRPGVAVIEDGTSTITITPVLRGDEVWDRYALIFEPLDGQNRLVIWDIEGETFVYDSAGILTVDDSLFEVEGLEEMESLLELGSVALPTSVAAAADLSGTPFVDGSTTFAADAGTDGVDVSLVEKYASLSSGYHELSYKDASALIPVGVDFDAANIVDESLSYGLYWKGLPVQGEANDKLGYLWQYVYRGGVYTYFTDSDQYFTDVPDLEFATRAHEGVTISALKAGVGGNACRFVITAGTLGTTITETDFGLDIAVTAVTSTSTYNAIISSINTALAAFTLANGVVASSLLEASLTSGSTGTDTLSALRSIVNLTGGVGGHVLTHEDLTGVAAPGAVEDKFEDGSDAQLRECNFGHQLATACHLASSYWQDCLGAISFSKPSAFGRRVISGHLGNSPTYTTNGRELYIDTASQNGSGVLGNKLLAGLSASGNGYRAHLVTDGGTNDSIAYGGLILTKGLSLPNEGKFSYGIDDGDEALDSNKRPVDIGRHIFVNASWGNCVSGWNSGARYKAPAHAIFMGALLRTAANVELIGENGLLRTPFAQMDIHPTTQDELAAGRIVFVKPIDGGTAPTFGACKTAALPSSDYSRMSTIRIVNQHLADIRRIARPFLGRPFTNAELLSLQASISQYCREQQNRGMNNGAAAVISYSNVDRTVGTLRVGLRIRPTFSMETITVSVSISE